MTEREYVIDIFRQNFSTFQNKNIALYGLGNQTKIILEEFPEYFFSALLDGYKQTGEVYGRSVISMDQLLDLGIEIIIIVARAASVKIIYKRISQFCKDNGIQVFDMNGNDLTMTEITVRDSAHNFSLSMDYVKNEINGHDAISFDIFDTLLVRKVMNTTDVFKIVQNRCNILKFDFAKERTLIERELAEKNPTISDIYKEIQLRTNITEAEAKELMYQEIQAEYEILTVRKTMKELLEYALSINKRVYLISDMYLSKEVITDILKINGIVGYDDLFISCEYHTGKRQMLFYEYKKQVASASYLHIGDDTDTDGISAKLNNIDYIIIDKAKDLLEKSTYSHLLTEDETLENNITVGLMAAEVFNDPFSLYHTDGRPSIKSAYQLGYTYIAPIISNYVIWLINNLLNKDFTEVLFISRDGYLIKQLYDIAIQNLNYHIKLPKSIYFLTSRVAGISATSYIDEIIEYAAALPFNGTPEDLLRKRFLLRDIDIKDYNDTITLKDYVLLHSDIIKKSAESLKLNYLKYINSLSLTKNGRIALIDFVSSGTCHMCIEDIIKQELEGFYFIRLIDSFPKKQQLEICSYYDSSFIFDHNNAIIRNYFLLESIIKSTASSVSHFNKEGQPVFMPNIESKFQKEYIEEIQKGIINYFKEYITLVKSKEIHSIRDNAERSFTLLQDKYSVMDGLDIAKFVINDEFCSRSVDLGSFI